LALSVVYWPTLPWLKFSPDVQEFTSGPRRWESDVMQTMRDRFTSGNGVPVERATIKPDEWGLVLAELSRRADALKAPQS
jgi:hypothetical protein